MWKDWWHTIEKIRHKNRAHPDRYFGNLGSIGLLCFLESFKCKRFRHSPKQEAHLSDRQFEIQTRLIFRNKPKSEIKKYFGIGTAYWKQPFHQEIAKKISPVRTVRKISKRQTGREKQYSQLGYWIKRRSNRRREAIVKYPSKRTEEKKWASEIGIDWMDGMPLTKAQISTFYKHPDLQNILDSLTDKGYLVLEHPKQKIGGQRIKDESLPKGYNIVSGKKSFEINKILDPNDVAPTLVAMDMEHLFVVDNGGLRTLTGKEGLRLFGYPDDYSFDIPKKDRCDLLGNTVAVPVIKAVSERLLHTL